MAVLSRAARKAETRREILRAASRLFATRGISATSIDRIAASIGLTSGAVYGNFKNKKELIDAVAEAAQLTVDPAEFLYRTDLSLAEKLDILSEKFFELRRQLSRELLLLTLELSLYEFRHSGFSKRVVELQRASRRDVGKRLERSGAALPMCGQELLGVITALAFGIVVELGRDPESLSDSAIRKAFALLSGEPLSPPNSRSADKHQPRRRQPSAETA